MKFTYNYPQPSITGDVIVWDRREDKILLIKRGGEPFKGCWAIVGGFFNPGNEHGPVNGQIDETVRDAAIRELKEEVNITHVDITPGQRGEPVKQKFKTSFAFLTVQDKPGRDPRGRVVTLVYVLTIWDGIEGMDIKALDDAAEYAWFPKQDIIDGKVPLAFDHLDSIQKFAKGLVYV
jgi:8-oxo-dGTP diphosphatase